MDGGGVLPPGGRGHAGGELLGRDPAAERHRRAAHGARAQRLDAGRAGPDEPDAGAQRALDPRHRPRRDRHPGGGREGAARRRHRAATSSAARRSSSGSGSGRRSTARGSSSSYKRLGASCDYERERFTLDEGYVTRRLPRLQAALRQGLHLPRQLHGQLGPGLALGDLRPRGREPRGRRHPLLDRLPGRGLRPGPDRRHRAAGDDARRHRRRREPRRRALRRPGRPALRPAAGRPPPADHRRRARRPRVRHRRAEDHPRPRPQRLRDRPQARARGDRRDRRGRPHDRGGGRAVRRA